MLPVRTDAAASILDLRHEITDTAIVFPESMHTDVHMMRKNWYLRNYTALDTVVSDPVPATDQVVTARLAAMPTGGTLSHRPICGPPAIACRDHARHEPVLHAYF